MPYIDVIISETTYQIVHVAEKPSNARAVVDKIEQVLNNPNFTYAKVADKYAQLPPCEQWKALEAGAEQIVNGYQAKAGSYAWMISSVKGTLSSLQAGLGRIRDRIREKKAAPASEKMDLPPEIAGMIAAHLSNRELMVAAPALYRREGVEQAHKEVIARAQALGYRGKDNKAARAYLSSFPLEMAKAAKRGHLPFVVKAGETPQILAQKLVAISPDEFLQHFENLSKYPTLLQCLKSSGLKVGPGNVHAPHALAGAIKRGDEAGVDFLLAIGVDPNQMIKQGNAYSTPLLLALNNKAIKEKLIAHGADIGKEYPLESSKAVLVEVNLPGQGVVSYYTSGKHFSVSSALFNFSGQVGFSGIAALQDEVRDRVYGAKRAREARELRQNLDLPKDLASLILGYGEDKEVAGEAAKVLHHRKGGH